jgi:hypothetical protein
MSEAYWKARYHAAERAFQKLKVITKQVPAGTWTADYRKLAEAVHTLGRDVFWVPLCGGCGKCEECLKVEPSSRGEEKPMGDTVKATSGMVKFCEKHQREYEVINYGDRFGMECPACREEAESEHTVAFLDRVEFPK